jgi:uncharacterized membrane protein YphA (DoxX/SURF4 family)
MRLAAGSRLVIDAILALRAGPPIGPGIVHVVEAGLGILLIVGFGTPIVGALVTVDALWNVYASGHPWRWIMLATLGAALTLIGPGAWSIDARLYGWKRVKISGQREDSAPPV